MAGGRSGAVEQVGDAQEAVSAREAHVQNGVHIFILLQIFDCIILFFSSFLSLLRIVFRGGLLLHFRFLDRFLFVFLCQVSVGLDGKDRNK